MSDTRLQRYYLQRQVAAESVIALFLSMVLNGYFLWNHEYVTFSGDSSVVGDLLATGMILPIAVGLMVTTRVRKHLRAAEIPGRKTERSGHIGARLLPSSLWLRVTVCAIYGVLAATLVLIALRVLGINSIAFWPYVIFVGTFGCVLAAYIAAISGYRAIVE
jgi:hypothetical protein